MSGWKYDPKDATQCLPKGEYEAVIKDCEYGTSKNSGNDMATLKVEVYDGDRKITVKDWVVNTPRMVWKLKHLARAVGAESAFESGMFEPHHAVSESVKVRLDVDDQDPKYGEQNRITDYMPSEMGQPKQAAGTKRAQQQSYAEIPADDDIPFD